MALWTADNLLLAEKLGWYDGKDATTVTVGTGGVSQWNDKFPDALHVSQASTTARPNYNVDTIEFDGVDEILFRTSAFMYDEGACSIFVVASGPGGQADKRLVAEGSSVGNIPIYNQIQTGTAGNEANHAAFYRTDANDPVINAGVLNTNVWDNTVNLIEVVDTGSAMTAYLDGSVGSTINYTRAATTLNRFAIGGLQRASAAVHIQANVKEIVITTVLSTADRQRMEGYLAHKWGLEANLPGGHPYKAAAPTTGGSALLSMMNHYYG